MAASRGLPNSKHWLRVHEALQVDDSNSYPFMIAFHKQYVIAIDFASKVQLIEIETFFCMVTEIDYVCSRSISFKLKSCIFHILFIVNLSEGFCIYALLGPPCRCYLWQMLLALPDATYGTVLGINCESIP